MELLLLTLVTSVAIIAFTPHEKACAMTNSVAPWYQLAVGERGQPTYVNSDRHNRVQREFLRSLYFHVNDEQALSRIESELKGALSGQCKEGGWGFSQGGAWGFDFQLDGKAVVWFEYDFEEVSYPTPNRELEMPLADFVALFRDWAASIRHWLSLGGVSHESLPKEKMPMNYPPHRVLE